ncbi:uncharacterized protein LOC135842993 [Planococcus citri]|uniref:uncharacterized protein LOC135842993 n=1 Tax=Planococcus citri TaxID=170843 RepID=UPI0031F77C0F
MDAFCIEDSTIYLFDKEKYNLVKTEENLLMCSYNEVKGFHSKEFAFKAIGRGEEENDVMDYEFHGGIATPYANHTGLLNKVHVITLEQLEMLKGKDFCTSKKNSDFLRFMCENIAQKNQIADYSEIQVDNACQQNIKTFIYSRAKRKNVNISPNQELLLCNYIRDNVTFASRALGRGKKENDVMEYTMAGDVAQPQVNRPGLLSEIHVLTLQQYKLLAGEEFCTTRKNDAEALKNLCVKVADANDYETYVKNELNATCWKSILTLFSEDEKQLVQIEENLLHCIYIKEIKPETESGEVVFKHFASKALGKGKGNNDVMEYDSSYSNYSYLMTRVTPFSNRVDFLIDKQVKEFHLIKSLL